MRTFDELFEGIIKHEGYYANIPGDKGGETYMGISRKHHSDWQGWNIIDEYKAQNGRIKHNQKIETPELTELVKDFYRHTFYHTYGIDHIENGALQEIIFDWVVNSGYWGSKGVQKVLNRSFYKDLKLDGIIGKKTISEINSTEPKALFDAIKFSRKQYYLTIAKRGQNHKFLNGWLKRLEEINYE